MTKPSKEALAARRRRVEIGERDEAEARKRSRPTHNQLMLPLLEEIRGAGGRVRPAEIYGRLAEKLQVAPELLAETQTFSDGHSHNLWQRHVRWARQTAVLKGYIANEARGVWELTEQGSGMLRRIRPGFVVTVFETDQGCALWATAEAAAGVIEQGSVNLIYCSPPYPISNGRAYGGFSVPAWLDWMRQLGARWLDLLQPDGSLMVNLGTVYQRGAPLESPYQERFILQMVDELGYHFAGRQHWYNPSKIASPMPWVVVRRQRVKASIEPILWFSKSKFPKADNRRVLVPYKPRTLKRYIGKMGEECERPSGYKFGAKSFSRDNGGAIPPNLIVAPGVVSNDDFRKKCRALGLPGHPAAYPEDLPDFGIRLTTEPGDLVYDPLAGSGTTAAAAERLGRRWITSEQALEYVQGAALRFEEAKGFAWSSAACIPARMAVR